MAIELSEEKISEVLNGVGNQIRRERKKQDMSMMQLAAASNLSVGQISKVEHARVEIGLKTLFKISAALGMSITDFLPYNFPLPCYSEQELSNGEKFERITAGASPQSVQFILEMVEHMVKTCAGNFPKRK